RRGRVPTPVPPGTRQTAHQSQAHTTAALVTSTIGDLLDVEPGEHAADGLRRVPGGRGDVPDGQAETGDRAQPGRERHAVPGLEPRTECHHRVNDDGADVVAA